MEGRNLHLSAVILAAGFSSRMGRLKALLPLNGHTALEQGIALFRQNHVRQIIVVTGHRSGQIADALQGEPVVAAHNPDYRQDMFSSVRTGVKCLDLHSRGIFILPVDIPLVRPATVGRLIQAFEDNPKSIIHPSFYGKRGHPPLIPADLATAVLAWPGTGGLRGFLAQHESAAVQVEVPDAFILEDMDSPEDYRRLRRARQHWEIPNRAECDLMLSEVFRVQKGIADHSRRVAEVAESLGRALLDTGEQLDLHLLSAAALLHDVAKGRLGHAEVGGAWLNDLGFGRVGTVVAAHHDLLTPAADTLDECAILYLADKLVWGDKRVPLEDRFKVAMERFGHQARVRAKILQRLDKAKAIVRVLERKTGKKLTALLPYKESPAPERGAA
ncbi:MAG: DVU_1551 family NTP transferase [Desulfobacterales bacterium]